MLQGKFRWKAIVLLVVCFGILAAGWFGLNRLQRRSIHGQFLEQAKRAEGSTPPQYDRAARFLRLYLLNKGDDVETWIRYGTLLEDKLPQTPKVHVLNAYERILDLDKNNKDIQLRTAKLYMQFNRFEDAFLLLKDLDASGAANADISLLLGDYAMAKTDNDKAKQKEQWKKAELRYREAIERAPHKLDGYVRLVQLLRTSQGKPDEAERILENMVGANQDSYRAYVVRSAFRQMGGDIILDVPAWTAALVGVSTVLSESGTSSAAAIALAAKKQRDLWSAGQDLVIARKLAPDNVDVLLASANQEVLLAREKGEADPKGHFAEGRKYLARAEKLHPNDVRVLPQFVTLELAAERRDEAMKILRTAQKKATDKKERVRLLWDLATLLVDDGIFTEADEVIAEMKKYGKEPYFLDFLRAKVAMRQNKWNEAIDLLEVGRPLLLARNPGMALQTDLYLGQCFEQLGDAGKQLVAYQRAQKLDPLNRAAQFGVARALAANNRLDEAIVESQALVGGQMLYVRLLILKNFRAPTANWDEVSSILKEIAANNPTAAMEVAILQAEVAFAEAIALETQAKTHDGKRETKDSQQKFAQAKAKADLAAKILEDAKKEFPKNIEPWIAASVLAGRQRDLPGTARALQILGEAEAKFPDRVDWRLAKLRYLPEKKEDALAFLRSLTADIKTLDRANQPAMLKGLAETFERIGENSQAEKMWRQLADLEPNRLGVHLLAFDFFLRRENESAMKEALGNIKRTEIAGGPFGRFGNAQIIIHRVSKRFKKTTIENWKLTPDETQELDEARRHLFGAAAKDPSWSRIPLSLATVAEMEGDTDLAIKHMRAAVDLGNRQLPLFKALVSNLMKKGRFVEVDEVLRKLQDGDLAADNYLQMKAAEISLFNKNIGQALDYTQRAVAEDSKSFEDYLWQGQMLGALNENKNAESSLRKAIKLAGDDPAPWVALVQFEARLGDVKKALEVTEELKAKVAMAKITLALAQCYQLIGQSQGQQDNGEKDYLAIAEKHYIQALAEQPNNPSHQKTVLQAIVTFYQNRGKPKETEDYLRRVLDPKLEPSEELTVWGNRSLALALAFQNDKAKLNEAMDYLERNLKKNPNSIYDQLVKGLLMAANPEKRAEAIKILERAFNTTTPTAEQMYVLANLYEANNEWRKAREYTIKLLGKYPNDEKYQIFLASFVDKLMIKKEDDEARRLVPALADSIKKNLTDKKKLANGTSILTALLRRHPSLEQSIVTEIGPTLRSLSRNTGDSHNGLAYADFLGNSGDLRGALAHCEQLLKEAKPPFKDVNPRQVIAIVVSAIGSNKAEKIDFDQAEKLVLLAREKDPKLPNEWDLPQAIIKERRGDYPAAEALYRSILVREPANPIVMNNLAFLLGLRGKSAEATELIQALITKIGPAAELLDTRAVIQLGQGKHADAEKDIRTALEDARTPYRLFHLALILRSAGKTGDAVKVLLEARRLGLRDEKMLHPLEIPQYEALLKSAT